MPTTPWKTRREAADYVRRSTKTLANLAADGRGPRFRSSTGRPLYHIEDLDAWIRGTDCNLTAAPQRGRRIASGGQHGDE